MREYLCTLCGTRLSAEETIQHYDRIYGELYVFCPHCHAECRPDIEEKEENEDQ
ncbi:MAG: hypothetical protein NC394_06765 [Bacteroides sp.]|nr:hypothetical protein [Bacteroides sp.]